jgi:tetratricopeptide (TPR) repeat protein
VSGLDAGAWEPIRAELESTALLRAETDVQVGDRPFLRFHPTLAIASANGGLVETPEVHARFIGSYLALQQTLAEIMRGSQPHIALEALSREETNYRIAIHRAVSAGEYKTAAVLGYTFLLYLMRLYRLREHDAWVQWLKDTVGQSGFTSDAAAYERQDALRLSADDPQAAVVRLQFLTERLRHTDEFDPEIELATTTSTLGRVLIEAYATKQAIIVLREAVDAWERIVENTAGNPWEVLLVTPNQHNAVDLLQNLSVTMGDLANALLQDGHHDEALKVAEQALRIPLKLGNLREVACSHARIADILVMAGRYNEADARYSLAIAAASRAGDRGLEAANLQSQSSLAEQLYQLDRATRLYQEAIRGFQAAHDEAAVMRTYNLVGLVEGKAGRLQEARAWMEKSLEMAQRLNNRRSAAAAALNIGVVYGKEGMNAREQGANDAALRCFWEGQRLIAESLRLYQALNYAPGEAASRSSLALINLLLGELDTAERYANEARQIREDLGLMEVWKDYNTLTEIAQARGNTTVAAEWARKRDESLAVLERRAIGGGGEPS